jgi:isocitrate dehydrogenase
VPGWTDPFAIGRYAYGDQYKATNFRAPGKSKLTLRFEPEDGGPPIERKVFDFLGTSIAMSIYNVDDSISSFARSCFISGLDLGWPIFYRQRT